MEFTYPCPLVNVVHPHPTHQRSNNIVTLHVITLPPPQETIRQYNIPHGRFEPIHGYRVTYAHIGTQRHHYGRIHDYGPNLSIQQGYHRIYGIDGKIRLYASPYYAVISRVRREDLVRLTSIYGADERRDFDEDFEHDFNDNWGLFTMM